MNPSPKRINSPIDIISTSENNKYKLKNAKIVGYTFAGVAALIIILFIALSIFY